VTASSAVLANALAGATLVLGPQSGKGQTESVMSAEPMLTSDLSGAIMSLIRTFAK
jgi:hypothetical protein